MKSFHTAAPTRLLAVGIAAVLAFSLLTSGTAGAAPADGNAMAGAPKAGDCFDATRKEAYAAALRKPVVSCAAKHTLKLVKVGKLPAGVKYGDTKAYYKAVSAICGASWRKVVGTDPKKWYYTLYAEYQFAPTKAQQSDGSRWVSCALGLDVGKKLVPLPSGTLPQVRTKPADSVARCVTGGRYTFVTCTKAHQYRTAYTFLVKSRMTEQATSAAVERAAAATCPRRTKTKKWLRSWRYADAHHVVVACYKRTSK